MNISPRKKLRLQFLARMVRKEIHYLQLTDRRLFSIPLIRENVEQLEKDVELAERVDAFVSRFGRLQDTVGDKLLPNYLNAVGETAGPAIDNLNRAEKLGLIGSAETWMTLRSLRKQMFHEYMEDLDKLTEALNTGHEHVSTLTEGATRILSNLETRSWI